MLASLSYIEDEGNDPPQRLGHDMGSGTGEEGGRIVAAGRPTVIAGTKNSKTAHIWRLYF
jgi:hypothetical protein